MTEASLGPIRRGRQVTQVRYRDLDEATLRRRRSTGSHPAESVPRAPPALTSQDSPKLGNSTGSARTRHRSEIREAGEVLISSRHADRR